MYAFQIRAVVKDFLIYLYFGSVFYLIWCKLCLSLSDEGIVTYSNCSTKLVCTVVSDCVFTLAHGCSRILPDLSYHK
jgi:hypothetical protein